MEKSIVNCKNCGNTFTGQFCPICGEKVYSDHDKSIGHFFEEGLHFITHLEGKFITTLKVIFKKPGKLSIDYCNGIRQKYFKPLSLFLLLVVVYLIFPLARGLNMNFNSHLGQPLYGKIATSMSNNYFKNHPDITDEQFISRYAAKSEKVSKLLLFIIIPLSAAVLYLTGKKNRPYFFDSMVISVEINSLLLLISFFLFPLLTRLIIALLSAMGIQIVGDEIINSLLSYFSFFFVAAIAIRSFYCLSSLNQFVQLFIFCFAHIFIVYFLYKFILFATVMLLM